MIAARNGSSYVTSIPTDISEYSMLRLVFDVRQYDLEEYGTERGDKCQIFSSLDDGEWVLEDTISRSNYDLFEDEVSHICRSCNATLLSLNVIITGDSTSGSDRCYYDNMRLQGLKRGSCNGIELKSSSLFELNETLNGHR